MFLNGLRAIDIATGKDKVGSPIEIKASAGSISFVPRIQNQRAGLALSKGQIIIAWGAHQDRKKYYGWVMSYSYDEEKNENRFVQTGTFVTTPGGNPDNESSDDGLCPLGDCPQGGVWQAGRAPAIDSQGRVLLFVGNDHNDTFDKSRGITSFGNSFVVLDPTSLTVLDFFTPHNFRPLIFWILI